MIETEQYLEIMLKQHQEALARADKDPLVLSAIKDRIVRIKHQLNKIKELKGESK